MDVTVVIPARLSSTRLPGKMLLAETGKPLIQHTYERVSEAKLPTRVVVATDSDRVAAAVASFRGRVARTSRHPNGTSRVAQAARRWPNDLIINVQGDEPEIEPEVLDDFIRFAAASAPIATLSAPLGEDAPDRVKVVSHDGRALYFSRTSLPGARLHLGIYGFHPGFLEELRGGRLGAVEVSQLERLEQLQWLGNGYPIRVFEVPAPQPGGIDTREDYDRFLDRMRSSRAASTASS